ncbi:cupin [Streptomyces sp. N2-109]|uniref:Cupin n=1 Tax=Streptomyces gossypii TaxID=2883101 RepID=A0ABT2JR27_9ACTN|nr:cupin [Streptomyces gossypii]MCT2590333.1 cupin [Streptomyces gossypii]
MSDIIRLAEDHLARARDDPHGRSAELVVHDGPLRQTVIALSCGAVLEEHNAPPAAGVHVLRGLVRLTGPAANRELGAGEVQSIPRERHGLEALDDSVVLLTTVTGI